MDTASALRSGMARRDFWVMPAAPQAKNTEAILDQLEAAAAFSERVESALAGHSTLFDGVERPAQAMLVALLLRAATREGRKAWVLCNDLKLQDHLSAELETWGQRTTSIPVLEIAYDIDALQDPETTAARLGIFRELAREKTAAKLTHFILQERSLQEDAPAPSAFEDAGVTMRPGEEWEIGSLTEQLEEAGYAKEFQVAERGQFAIRGGILDVFSWQAELPLRVEFFGDEIDSLRFFDEDTQTSVERITEAEILLKTGDRAEFCKVADYVSKEDLIVVVDCPEDISGHARITTEEEDFGTSPTAALGEPLGVFEAGDFVLQEQRRETFLKQVSSWREDGWEIVMFFNNEGEEERFRELVDPEALADLTPVVGHLTRGFSIASAKLVVLADAEIFGRYQQTKANQVFKKESKARQARSTERLRQLSEGDIVVHADYGIGRFLCLEEAGANAAHGTEEVLVIEYADEAKLYAPLHQSHLITRYVGSGTSSPPLSQLGGGRWSKTRAKAEASVLDYAAQLLNTQAKRAAHKAYNHPPDDKWQLEFESSFLYRETPDQMRAIREAKADMESPEAMDRLVCGDVGFGKTEVAIRTAFKCVMGGRQVAILVPTTVLAGQHFQTFRERMSEYPVKIGLLSRFRTAGQQRKVVEGVANGSVDIVIGTHRLISKDISFHKLGLVVIDEEQRFGVKHKERFKELFQTVDILTLSATPIPRTLYLSLMGVRDMSSIDTAPVNRHPVQTIISPYDERVIKQAMERELDRGGQIYFLHNRVADINKVAKRLNELVPKARIVVGHGQMEEGALEPVMQAFIDGEADILVSTTIIESGIDIPNANTIIIDRADRFGLADLYQLRGRVGRSTERAHALLLLPRKEMATGESRKRLNAIRQYSALGAGFQIAMRDLEIRGAGNLLGTKQSGHIAAVGFDLYCQLLKSSVAKLTGKAIPGRVDVGLHLDVVATSEAEIIESSASVAAFIPASFIEEPRMRILAYRSLAEVGNKKELTALEREWRDRFGQLPEEIENLLLCTRIKLAAAGVGIDSVELEEGKVKLSRRGGYLMPDKRFPRLTVKSGADSLHELLKLIQSA